MVHLGKVNIALSQADQLYSQLSVSLHRHSCSCRIDKAGRRTYLLNLGNSLSRIPSGVPAPLKARICDCQLALGSAVSADVRDGQAYLQSFSRV